MTTCQRRGASGSNQAARLFINVDGVDLETFEGETIAGALLANGRLEFRETHRCHAPRGMYCGMGVCYDCLVTVDGQHNVRSCITRVREGLRVTTQRGEYWGESE